MAKTVMKTELQEKLYSKYPKIFRQKDLSMNQTCMCWGIECGDGWYDIIDELCQKIQQHIDKAKTSKSKQTSTIRKTKVHRRPQIEAVQVKEKWGGLRFYVNFADKYVDDLIDNAEKQSYKTCEVCGSVENVSLTKSGWCQSLCSSCMLKKEHKI